jgi:hypothetical protein
MELTNNRDPNKHVYSRVRFFSPGTVRLFRFLTVFLILMGALLLALGVLATFSRTHSGSHFPAVLPIVCFLGGVLSLWGYDFGHGRVVVTASGIKTRNRMRRSVHSDEIAALDILHSELGKPDTTTPTLFLRSGKSIALEPLQWSEQIGSEQPAWTYGQQQKIINEIRTLLRLDGRD